MCTLKSFPNQIEHTLQWAREWFEEVFKQTPDDVNQYLSSPDFMQTLANQQNMKIDTLNRVKLALIDERPHSMEDCVIWARLKFEDLFSNKIKQLLHSLPLDKLTTSGTLFWSGAKKAPSPIVFDICDPLHIEFIKACALMRAETYGIATQSYLYDDALYISVAPNVPVPVFSPIGETVAATEEEAKAEAEARAAMPVDIDDQCSHIFSLLPPKESLGSLALKGIDFDKDTDDHIRVVASCSNLRARNYNITEADMHTSRGIAGKITPAIATTTALVTGAICLEIYKLVQRKDADKYRNSFTNLALPLFTNMEPQPPKTTKSLVNGKEWKWTPWDRIDISQPDMTLAELLKYLEDEYGVELSMLSSGVSILYSNFMNKKKMNERMGQSLKGIVESVTKHEMHPKQKYMIFEIIVTDLESGDDIEVPYLRFKLF